MNHNEKLRRLRERKHELEAFRYPSPGAVREHADIIRRLQALHEEAQNALLDPQEG